MLTLQCNMLVLLPAEHVQHERASFATVPHLSESHDLHSGGYRYCVLQTALLARCPLKWISCRHAFHSIQVQSGPASCSYCYCCCTRAAITPYKGCAPTRAGGQLGASSPW